MGFAIMPASVSLTTQEVSDRHQKGSLVPRPIRNKPGNKTIGMKFTVMYVCTIQYNTV